jgi:quercetin dioxygenase-like cupin family protein
MAIEEAGQGAERALQTMSAPSLRFDLDGEARRLWDERASRVGRNAKTLVKHQDLRLVLTVLRAGGRIQEHKASGRISIQTLQGHLRMRILQTPEGELIDLPAGRLLVLDQGVPHDVEAVADSAFLLTVAWPQGERQQAPGADQSAARAAVGRDSG